MQNNWKDWEDQSYDVFKRLDNPKQRNFPRQCPHCRTNHLHFYMNRHITEWGKNNRGSTWIWCSNCKKYEHCSCLIPEWWENAPFIDVNNFAHDPGFLEENKNQIDIYVNKLFSEKNKE